MDVVSVNPGIVVVPRSQLAASEPLLHLYGLYRRAVVLRAEIQGAAWLQPTGDVVQERTDFAHLRADLSQQQIELAAGDLDAPQMAEELAGAMAAIEGRLQLDPAIAAAILLHAYEQ